MHTYSLPALCWLFTSRVARSTHTIRLPAVPNKSTCQGASPGNPECNCPEGPGRCANRHIGVVNGHACSGAQLWPAVFAARQWIFCRAPAAVSIGVAQAATVLTGLPCGVRGCHLCKLPAVPAQELPLRQSVCLSSRDLPPHASFTFRALTCDLRVQRAAVSRLLHPQQPTDPGHHLSHAKFALRCFSRYHHDTMLFCIFTRCT